MQLRLLASLLGIPLALAVSACGDDETGTTTTSSSTTTTTTTSSSSTGGGATIHDCDQATATDQTGEAAVTITTTGFAYTPPCVRVKSGTAVTFESDFTTHPLVGGEFADGIKTPDTSSPIKPTNTGMTATFTFDAAGAYPFYCNVHASTKMYGVVFVE